MRVSRVLSCVALLAAAPASAAPGTAEQAQSIRQGLERYLGKGAPGGAAPVSVTPNADGYKIDIDLPATLHALAPMGITIDPGTISLRTAPRDDGTWTVKQEGQQRVTAKLKDKVISFVVNALRYEGVYDPRIPAFTSSTATYDSTSFASTGSDGPTQTREEQKGQQTVTATASGDGIIDLEHRETLGAYSQDVMLDKMPGPASGPPGRVAVKAGASSVDGSVKELHVRALADLWAFLVAHSDTHAIVASQEELRGLLRAALPLMRHVAQTGSMTQISVDSPVGAFAAKSARGGLDANGLVQDGRLSVESGVEGLAIPPGLVPGWASGLVPETIDIKESLSGFRLDTAAADAVDFFDLAKPDPFTPEQKAKLLADLGPLENIILTLAPSRLVSPLVTVQFEGRMSFARPIPNVDATIRATGLDAAIKDIQAKAGPDKTAAQLTAVLILAKGLGKAEPDGALTWAIAKNDAGEITVNGIGLPMMAGK